MHQIYCYGNFDAFAESVEHIGPTPKTPYLEAKQADAELVLIKHVDWGFWISRLACHSHRIQQKKTGFRFRSIHLAGIVPNTFFVSIVDRCVRAVAMLHTSQT